MKITQNGLELTLLQEIINGKFDNFSKNMGEEFNIEAESLVANLLIAIALMQRALEKDIAFLMKQFDPETAEGIYQDALYERVGLKRIQETPTTFTLTVRGTAGTNVPAGSLFVEDIGNKNLFYNSDDFEFDENGVATGIFQSFLVNCVLVTSGFNIYEAPDNVTDIILGSCENIILGNPRETDSEFRDRFHKIRDSFGKCSHDAILRNLSKLTDGYDFIRLDDVNTNPEIPAGTVLITAKSAVSDEDFCKAIFNNTLAGINFSGNTTVTVPVSNGQSWQISYQKAEPVSIDIGITLKLKSGYYQNSVFKNVKENLIAYTASHTYGLGKTVYSAEFIKPVLDAEGVEGIILIGVKRHSSVQYSDYAEIMQDEYAVFDETGMDLTLEE